MLAFTVAILLIVKGNARNPGSINDILSFSDVNMSLAENQCNTFECRERTFKCLSFNYFSAIYESNSKQLDLNSPVSEINYAKLLETVPHIHYFIMKSNTSATILQKTFSG